MTSLDERAVLRTLERIVYQAVEAPSVHNTQPWRFAVSPERMTLSADRTRQLHVLDPTARQLTISCGCALFNARIAAAVCGLPVRITRLPDGETSPVLAHLEIVDPSDPACDDPGPLDEVSALDAMIVRRQTNRRRFSDQHVPVEVLDAVRAAAAREGAIALEIHDEDHRVALARLSQRADVLQYADPAYRAELRAWTTDDPKRTDGVPAIAVPHVDAGSGDEVPIRDFDTRGSGFLPTNTSSTRNQCFVLLGTEADNPMAWLRTGEALERMLLEITRLGLVASPLTQVVEVPSARAALRAELGLSMYPHVLLRIGYAPQTAGTPRRPVDAVLDTRE